MLFRQLFDAKSSTFTYLLADEKTREAVLIDGVFEQLTRDAALIDELGLRLLYSVETHVHADHVTSASLMKDRFGSKIVLSAESGAEGADVKVRDGDFVRFGSESLRVISTPGHTNGCVTYVTGDQKMAFTGDALLVRAAGRTDFQQGDAGKLFHSVHDKIFGLPESTLLYPAHDYLGRTATSVWEEKRFNPRLGGDRSEGDFVGYMSNLGLPHPKQIDIAVPANLRCGRPEHVAGAPSEPERPTWGPVTRTFAGVPQIGAEWLEEHLNDVYVLDVREPAETTGELGSIPGSHLIPLGQLRARVSEIPKDKPIIAVCRAGARSAQACTILEANGYKDIANLDGGMIKWRALRPERE